MKVKKPLSTGEVARYCRVSSVTVFNWIKSDKISYHTTAGGQYRVERPDLVKFLNKYGMPVPDELLVGDKIKVLACDDDVAILEVIRAAYETNKDFEVQTVSDGYTGLMELGRYKPDLLILDIMMPGIDGYEVCERVKANPDFKTLEILILTGVHEEESARRLKLLGIKNILKKPIKLEDLRAAVAKVLKLPAY